MPLKPKNFKRKSNPTHRQFNPKDKWALLYDRDWNAYRDRFLAINSRCYVCGDKAHVVDHVRPAQGDVELFEKTDNHIPICATCHNRVTAMFDRYFVAGKSIDRKLKWIADERLKRGLANKVKVLPAYR